MNFAITPLQESPVAQWVNYLILTQMLCHGIRQISTKKSEIFMQLDIFLSLKYLGMIRFCLKNGFQSTLLAFNWFNSLFNLHGVLYFNRSIDFETIEECRELLFLFRIYIFQIRKIIHWIICGCFCFRGFFFFLQLYQLRTLGVQNVWNPFQL